MPLGIVIFQFNRLGQGHDGIEIGLQQLRADRGNPVPVFVQTLDNLPQGLAQFLAVPGFGEKTINFPLVDGLDHHIHFGVTGQNHAHDLRITALDLTEKFQARSCRACADR